MKLAYAGLIALVLRC